MKKFFEEFKQFISRGNVLDLAVGVIVGGAFQSIVKSLVNDIVMPFVGMLFGGIDFTKLRYVIKEATETTPEAAIYYGNFIQNVVNFLLVAFVMFCAIKAINKFHRKKDAVEEAKPNPTPEDIELLREIRDLLKAR